MLGQTRRLPLQGAVPAVGDPNTPANCGHGGSLDGAVGRLSEMGALERSSGQDAAIRKQYTPGVCRHAFRRRNVALKAPRRTVADVQGAAGRGKHCSGAGSFVRSCVGAIVSQQKRAHRAILRRYLHAFRSPRDTAQLSFTVARVVERRRLA